MDRTGNLTQDVHLKCGSLIIWAMQAASASCANFLHPLFRPEYRSTYNLQNDILQMGRAPRIKEWSWVTFPVRSRFFHPDSLLQFHSLWCWASIEKISSVLESNFYLIYLQSKNFCQQKDRESKMPMSKWSCRLSLKFRPTWKVP